MFRHLSLCLAFAPVLIPVFAASAQTPANAACANASLGINGSLNGFVPSPKDAWHQDISALAVSRESANILTESAADLAGTHLHPDFGAEYGIPYNVVDTSLSSTQTQINLPIAVYPDDSDQTFYPVQTGMAIEGFPNAAPPNCPTDNSDRHMIVLDRYSCTNYEMYQSAPCNGSWSAAGALLFDLLTTEQRPFGLSSADASGLSVFEGLVRYDEILAGSINHAIRFTAQHTRRDSNGSYFVSPATHGAGTLYGTDNLMGMRIRLKAGFDISGFSPTNQIILTAMKKYGLILTDNGSNLFFQGTQDSRWDDDDLSNLGGVLSNDMEVVAIPKAYDGSNDPTGQAPVISNFTATPSVVEGQTLYILSANVTGGTYSFMNSPGENTGTIFRGVMTVNPTATTTYTLTSRNLYGTTQASVTVTIPGPETAPQPPHARRGGPLRIFARP